MSKIRLLHSKATALQVSKSRGNLMKNYQAQNIESLLAQSCSLYQELGSVYAELSKNISSSPLLIQRFSQQIAELQEECKVIDKEIKNRLTQEDKQDASNRQLLTQREELLKRLIQHNKTLSKNAGNVKSHIMYEMNSMNTNRNAINGYKPAHSGNTGRINNSF